MQKMCLPALFHTSKCALYIGSDLRILTQIWQAIHNQHHRVQNPWHLQNMVVMISHTPQNRTAHSMFQPDPCDEGDQIHTIQY